MKRVALCSVALLMIVGCHRGTYAMRDRAIEKFELGQIDESKQLMDQVFAKLPSDGPNLYYLGRVAHSRGYYERAVYWYLCCLDADPKMEVAKPWLEKARDQAGMADRHVDLNLP